MKAMGAWDNDLCPCCKLVPEESTTHLFLCPETSMSDKRNKLFGDIIKWLPEVDTDPLITDIITAFWHNKPLQLGVDTPYMYRQQYSKMIELGVQSMWRGFIPGGLVDIQHYYYKQIGSRRSGKRWGEQLIGQMLQATLNLWLQRNSMVHCKDTNDLDGMDMVQLEEAVETQLIIGEGDVDEGDRYLFQITIHDIMAKSIEEIRGWLCSVLIARGDLEGAEKESSLLRGEHTHKRPRLSASQQRQYLHWRYVSLMPHTT